jgi:phage portal protein BeeE
MSIFSGLFRSRDKPTDSTTGSTYRFLFGGTTSGKAVTERTAMQMTAVYSCVRILAEAVAGLAAEYLPNTTPMAARKRQLTIRFTLSCTMSRIRK